MQAQLFVSLVWMLKAERGFLLVVSVIEVLRTLSKGCAFAAADGFCVAPISADSSDFSASVVGFGMARCIREAVSDIF